MSDALLTALKRAFDLCIIDCSRPGSGEDARHSVLRLLTPVPDWLASAFAASSAAVPTLGETLPFLDHFLVQAEEVWHEGHPASATSEPFVATVNGTEVLLRAVAIAQHEHRLIVLQRLTGAADMRPMLQKAREQALELERLVQRAGTLHEPAAAIESATQALLATTLSPEQQGLVDRLSRASAELRGALTGLPAPPPRRRRQGRS